MRTRILLLTIVSMFLGIVSCLAQNTLNIHQKDGGVVSYGFAEKPVVTYTDNGIHLATDKVEVDFPFDNLEKFTFSDDESNGIDVLTTEGARGDICIYNPQGVLVKIVNPSEGVASFSTTDLSAGTYIIKNGKTTYKIIKR